MKKLTYTQAGFGHIAVVFLVLFVAVVGFAGYKVATMNKTASPEKSVAAQQNTSATVPAHIESKADLQAAAHALDDAGSNLDSSLGSDSLSADMNAML